MKNIRKYKLDFKGNGQEFCCKKVIYETQSKFQKIEISDLELLGRVLVLDDIIQLSELDCDIYHESFAHIPMTMVKAPEKVLILGGGDGILAKEILKYDNVQIDLVDIDSEVCKASQEYLSNLNNGALKDQRVNVHNLDALAFCSKANQKNYDVIFGDITDPHPNSPSSSLLSNKALQTYKRILKQDGVIAIQTDNVQIAPNHILKISDKLENYFKYKSNFSIVAITLGGLFSFVCFSNSQTKRSNLSVPTRWLDEEKVKTNFNLHNYMKAREQ